LLQIFWLLGPFFITTVALGGIIVPKLDLALTLVCREYLAGQAANDPTFTFAPVVPFADNPQCDIPEVSALATNFTLGLNLIAGILSAIAAPKLGALSDRYGRISILAATTCGGLLSEVVTIITAKYPETVNYRWLLFGAVFEGLCGSFISGMAISHSYATDCTPPAKRAVAFGYFHACLFSGVAVGPVMAAIIVKQTGTVVSLFYTAFVAHLIFLFFLVFVIPESLAKKRQLAAREKHAFEERNAARNGSRSSKIRSANPLAPLKILYPTGPGSSPEVRRNLILLSVVDTIVFGAAMGGMTVIIYYSKLIFHWGSYESNLFIAILNSCRVSALVILLPGLNYIFRTRYRNRVLRESGVELVEKQSGSDQLDLYTIRASLLLETIGFAGYLFAASGNVFIAVGAIASIGGIGSPTVQSALTKHVPHDRVGQLLGATGLLHALARIVFPIFFSQFYIWTVKSLPQAVFGVFTVFFAFAFLVSWGVRPHSKFSHIALVIVRLV
jgi:MFS family permease